ncbi:hypothetical protein [Methylobacterium crusticola]|nr:hypothetical protein [Methylobacterium crusticola]
MSRHIARRGDGMVVRWIAFRPGEPAEDADAAAAEPPAGSGNVVPFARRFPVEADAGARLRHLRG